MPGYAINDELPSAFGTDPVSSVVVNREPVAIIVLDADPRLAAAIDPWVNWSPGAPAICERWIATDVDAATATAIGVAP